MGGWKKGAEKGEGCREGSVRAMLRVPACGGGEGDVTDGGEGEGGGGKGVGGEGGDGEGRPDGGRKEGYFSWVFSL